MGPIEYSGKSSVWLPKPVYKGIIASALEDDHTYSDSLGKEDDLLFSR